ncbi:MAG TPA: ATP-binding protein, partial [Acidimicrobiales bacterium]|nr:ATP-binding protein [Acidimicrobiales bacterium]
MDLGSRRQQRLLGLLAGLSLVGLGTLVLLPSRDSVTVATPALVLVIPGIVAGLVGGRLAGVLTAAVAALALDVGFIEPYGRPNVHLVDDVVALTAFGAVALMVATLVAQANDRRRAAEQRAQEVLRLSEEKARIERDQIRLSSEKSALEQAEAARRALLRSVSHDLRTPLAAIRAITSDLRAGPAYDAQTRDELLDVVGDEAERLDRLVANLLSLTRIESGALEPELQAVDLAEMLDDRVRRLSRVLRDVRVETTLPVGLPLVDADYTLLDQVVTNLLENAARHAPRHSVIHIDAQEAGDLMEISISDEGPGVPPAQREWIFEPFRSGDASHSSGIGLAICKAIVEAHGGTITAGDRLDGADGAGDGGGSASSAGSAGSGRGARFTFTLPIHRMGPTVESPATLDGTPPSPITRGPAPPGG